MSLDYAVRINGDNIFTPWDILSQMIAIAKTDNYQFISNGVNDLHNYQLTRNSKQRNFPKGMNIEIIQY
jgi:hypothetical protein